MYSVALDWLSFTLKGLQDEAALLQMLTPDGEMVTITPRNGYTRAYASNIGVQFHSNPDRSEMGTHVIVPGSSLRMLEQAGFTTKFILRAAIQAGGKCTRIDLAKDAKDERIYLPAIYTECGTNRRTGTAQTINERRQIDGGHTIYVGSWHSDNFFRMYDKAAEQNVGGDWKRLELVCKSDVAKAWARVLSDEKSDWNALLCGKVRKMLNIEVDGYNRWLDGAAVDGLPQVEKRSDREKWILTQVIPAVLEHARDNPSSVSVKLLIQALEFEQKRAGDIKFDIE